DAARGAAPVQRARPLPPPQTPVQKRVARPAVAGKPERSNAALYWMIGGGAGVALLLLVVLILILSGSGSGSDTPPNVNVVVHAGGEEEKKDGKGGAPVPNQPVIEDQ